MLSRHQPEVVLRADDLGKQYRNGTWGIRHASVAIPAGRMIAVLGPNGAGKSTLIHMLAGAIQPTEGSMELTDPRTRLGWSSQRTTIDWYLSVRRNVEIGGRMYGINRRECAARADALLERFHLADLAKNDVSMLSGGQQQRVQIARTLMSDPDLMLLDEPTASLDVESSEAVLGYLRERAREGRSVLVSSHDLGLLEGYCDDVLFVLNGSIVGHQPMGDFLRQFTPEDRLTIVLAEPVSDQVMVALASRSPMSDPQQPHVLSLTLAGGESLRDIVHRLGDLAEIVEARRETASLRSVYLRLTASQEHER